MVCHCRLISNTLGMFLTTHQNAILLVDALNWEVTYKDLVNKVVSDPSNCKCIMHQCTNCPGTNALHKFLEEELSDIDPDCLFHYSLCQNTGRGSLVTVTSTCEEYEDTLILAINSITKHLFLAKCQANFLRAKKESLQANEVIVLGYFIKNYQFLVFYEIQSYHWSKEYCTLHPLVVYFIDSDGNIQHNSCCIISDDNNHNTNFVYKIQTILVDYLKTFQLWIRSSILLVAVLKNIRITKPLLCHKLCHHQQDFNMNPKWILFATSHGRSPCDGVKGVQCYVAKLSLQKPT